MLWCCGCSDVVVKKIGGSFASSWLSHKHIFRSVTLTFMMVPCLLSLHLQIFRLPSSLQFLLKLRSQPARRSRQIGVMVAHTARRTLYPRRNGNFHIAAVNDPRDCLPRAPIALRRSTHSHPRCPAFRLIPSSPLRLCERLMYPRLVLRRATTALLK